MKLEVPTPAIETNTFCPISDNGPGRFRGSCGSEFHFFNRLVHHLTGFAEEIDGHGGRGGNENQGSTDKMRNNMHQEVRPLNKRVQVNSESTLAQIKLWKEAWPSGSTPSTRRSSSPRKMR